MPLNVTCKFNVGSRDICANWIWSLILEFVKMAESDNRNALMGEWRSTWQICICVDGRGDPEQTDPGLMGFCCPFLHYHVVTAGKIHCVESLNAWHLLRVIADTNLTLNTSVKMVKTIEPFSSIEISASPAIVLGTAGERLIGWAVGL